MAANSEIPAGLDKEQIFSMLGMEMEYKVELFNRLAMTCFNKCVDKRYLNLYENEVLQCDSDDNTFFLDFKHTQVNNIIGQMLSAGQRPM